MAVTGITVVLIAVLIQSIYASKPMNVDSHQLADKEVKENPLKRTRDPYEYLGGCYDNHDYCQYWASNGECYNNPTYMHSTCQYSCGTCSGGIYFNRDITRNFGYSSTGTRNDFREQLRTNNQLKWAKELRNFFHGRRSWPHSQGNRWSQGTRETESE